jgi:hypothetical protein
MLFLLPVLAAPPTNAPEVHALLSQLLDAEDATRVAATEDLLATPPMLLNELAIANLHPACAERVAERNYTDLPTVCHRWNQAMVHYIRVVGQLAWQTTDPTTRYGAWCLPRTQPRPGVPVREPACGTVSQLRLMINDGFDVPEFLEEDGEPLGFSIPDHAKAARLTQLATEAYRTALTPTLTFATLPHYPSWAGTDGYTQVNVVPLCGGLPSFQEVCAYHVVVQHEGRFETTAWLPPMNTSDPDGDLPYGAARMLQAAHVRVDGKRATFITDGGSGGDESRRYWVYDVSAAPRLICRTEGAITPTITVPTVNGTTCSL